MVTVFFGKDSFESELAARSAAKHAGDFYITQAGNTTLANFVADLGGGLFQTPENILLLNPKDNMQIWNYLSSNNLSKSKHVFVWHPSDLLKSEKAELEQAEASLQEYLPITEDYNFAKILTWLLAQAKDLNMQITNAQGLNIINVLGSNKYYLYNFLVQLQNSPNIALAINELQPMHYPDYLPLTAALLSGDIKTCINLLASADSQNETSAVIGLITWQLQQLLIYFESGPGSLSKQQKYFLSKYAKRFTLNKVQKLVQSLYNIDISVRLGNSSPVNALTLYSLMWK